MSGDERVLRDALRARAEDVDTVADFVGPSVRLARRRARRAAAAGVTAAALVVGGVSVATWVAARPSAPEPVPATVAPTPPQPTPTPSTTPSPSPSPSDIPTSAPPSTNGALEGDVPWAADSTIHLPTGAIDVGEGRVIRGFAPLAGGGALVATDPGEPGSPRWRIFAADGTVVEDLGRPAWVEAGRDGRLLALGGDSGEAVVALDERGRRLGSKDLGGRVVAVADGWVWVTSETGTRGWQVATGEVRTLDHRLLAVSADGRRAAAVTPDDDGQRGCWRVVDLTERAAPVLLERCGDDNPEGFSPQEFSADGELLIGSDDADGGFYFRLVVARVADGRVVVGRSTHGEEVDGWTWALAPDGGSILLSRNIAEPRFPANRNDLARCTVQLECTRVEGPARLGGGDVTQPRYVVGQPLLGG